MQSQKLILNIIFVTNTCKNTRKTATDVIIVTNTFEKRKENKLSKMTTEMKQIKY